MNKSPEISVIVPVYNVEKYLPKCLDSILSSTFEDIEVILVDDCGPDNSRAICEEYASKDKRVRIITNPHNMGLSAARNNGLDNARGKYISFVDSDDFINTTMYEKMYTAITRENVDIVGCNAWNYKNSTQDIIRYLDVKNDTKTSFEKLGNKIYESPFHVWRFLYKKEILQNIRFDIIPFEDAVFMIKLYPQLSNIYFLAEPLYFYCKHPGTLSVKCHKRNMETLKIKDIIINAFNQNPRSELIRDNFWKWYTQNLTEFYKLVPHEMQSSFINEVRNMLPYINYQYFINRIEKSCKKYYLFDFILLLTVARKNGKKHVKLFGKIPLYKERIEYQI